MTLQVSDRLPSLPRRLPCPPVTALALALALAACGDSGSESGAGSATQVTSVSASASATATATTGMSASGTTEGSAGESESGVVSTGGESESAGTSSTTSSFPKLDVGSKDDLPSDPTTEGGEQGCRKVDFLFVIDNSGSMGDEQQSLIASFPGFIAAIKDTLKEAQDYHIMVVDTDAWVFGGCDLICPLFFNTCPPAGLDYMCGSPPLECEDVLGAGVVHPRGNQSSKKDCSFTSGYRWMDIGEPDLSATFACAAQVGTGSTQDPEKPMEAMVQAVAPQGPAHDCNDGFIRDDAILVVTFITDEDDNQGGGSAGTPDGWKAALVSAKKGDDSGIVVLGLFGDNDQQNAICPPFDEENDNGAEPSARLNQFVDLFGDKGIKGSVCADSYDAFFQQAVGLIDTTCEDFVPPQ